MNPHQTTPGRRYYARTRTGTRTHLDQLVPAEADARNAARTAETPATGKTGRTRTRSRNTRRR